MTTLTEADWWSCQDLWVAATFLGWYLSDRQQRLLGCAYCRRIWPMLTDPRSRAAVEVAERFADSLASEQDRQGAAALGGYVAT